VTLNLKLIPNNTSLSVQEYDETYESQPGDATYKTKIHEKAQAGNANKTYTHLSCKVHT